MNERNGEGGNTTHGSGGGVGGAAMEPPENEQRGGTRDMNNEPADLSDVPPVVRPDKAEQGSVPSSRS